LNGEFVGNPFFSVSPISADRLSSCEPFSEFLVLTYVAPVSLGIRKIELAGVCYVELLILFSEIDLFIFISVQK
jgi:hypothetical protein